MIYLIVLNAAYSDHFCNSSLACMECMHILMLFLAHAWDHLCLWWWWWLWWSDVFQTALCFRAFQVYAFYKRMTIVSSYKEWIEWHSNFCAAQNKNHKCNKFCTYFYNFCSYKLIFSKNQLLWKSKFCMLYTNFLHLKK